MVWFDQDQSYLRALEAERLALTGPLVSYWSLDRHLQVDVLYDEPIDMAPSYLVSEINFRVGFRYQEADDRDTSVSEDGSRAEHSAEVYLSYDQWTALNFVDRQPKRGDVLELLQVGLKFDVVSAKKSGNVIDTQTNVGWKLELKRRTEFAPERKM